MLTRLILAGLRAYKWLVSPLLLGGCRFSPTCSEYAAEAVHVHGPVRGLWLGLVRLARCQPLGTPGFDPVPPAPASRD